MQSEGTCVIENARQLISALESHHEVCVVSMLDLSRAVGSTGSHLNILRVELDSHADTCVVGQNALIVHEHTNVVMVSGFDPSQPP
jgi:hypothetical protein